MNETGLEAFVLQYLKQKGYTEAEVALERHIRAAAVAHEPAQASTATPQHQDGMSLTDRLSVVKGVVEHVIASFDAAGPQSYLDAMDAFASWVDQSLDAHRAELSRLLYPLVLYTYLALVGREASQQASTLLSKYQKRLVEMNGALSDTRAAELTELQSVAVKQHLSSNAFVKQVLSSKQTVRLGSYGNDLLMHFLHGNPRMLCLAAILNQHIAIEVTDQPEVGLADGAAGGGAGGWADTEALNINLQLVNLGLIKGNPEDRYADLLEQKHQEEAGKGAGAAAAAAAAAPALGADGAEGAKADAAEGAAGVASTGAGTAAGSGTVAPKKGKKAAATDAAAAADKSNPFRLHPGDRAEPQYWTPQLAEGLITSWVQDVELRTDLTPAPAANGAAAAAGGPAPSSSPSGGWPQAPSCCFFTFANTRQSLTCAAFSLPAHLLAAGFADSSVRLWDLSKRSAGGGDGLAGRRWKAPAGHGEGGEEGGGGGSGRQQGSAAVAAVDEEDEEEDTEPGVAYLYGHTGPVHALSFSPDSRMLLSASADGTVRAWTADFGAALAAYRGHVLPVWDVAFGPWGHHFATGSADRTARVWSTDLTRMLRVLAGHQADVDVVGWHPNTLYVASASTDRTARLWDVGTGTCVRVMTGLPSAPTCLAVHPDGKHLAVGCDQGSVLVWELGSAKQLASFKAHQAPVWCLSYSRGQGTLLATGGADDALRVWSTHAAPRAADGGPPPVATPAVKPYSQVISATTKSTSVTALHFSHRNLLLGAGAFNLRRA